MNTCSHENDTLKKTIELKKIEVQSLDNTIEKSKHELHVHDQNIKQLQDKESVLKLSIEQLSMFNSDLESQLFRKSTLIEMNKRDDDHSSITGTTVSTSVDPEVTNCNVTIIDLVENENNDQDVTQTDVSDHSDGKTCSKTNKLKSKNREISRVKKRKRDSVTASEKRLHASNPDASISMKEVKNLYETLIKINTRVCTLEQRFNEFDSEHFLNIDDKKLIVTNLYDKGNKNVIRIPVPYFRLFGNDFSAIDMCFKLEKSSTKLIDEEEILKYGCTHCQLRFAQLSLFRLHLAEVVSSRLSKKKK